jgi:hypothetical protein
MQGRAGTNVATMPASGHEPPAPAPDAPLHPAEPGSDRVAPQAGPDAGRVKLTGEDAGPAPAAPGPVSQAPTPEPRDVPPAAGAATAAPSTGGPEPTLAAADIEHHGIAVAHQVAIHIARSPLRPHERLSIALEPAELGLVQIRIDLAEPTGPRAVIAADRPETLEMLRSESHQLERSLRDAGLDLGSAGIGFSLRQDGQPQQRHDAPAAQTPGWSAPVSRHAEAGTAGSRIDPSRILDLEV